MKGLLWYHYYSALASAKWFAAVLLVLGITAVILGRDFALILFSLLCIVGFSVNSLASLRKESASKWGRYQITAPVQRRNIVKGHYLSQLLWTLAGVLVSGACVGLSLLFHGFFFDAGKDIAAIFCTGLSISLLMGGIFYPLFYLGGEERNEVVLGLSLLGSIAIYVGLVYLINLAFSFQMSLWQIWLSMAILLFIAALVFLFSYLAAVRIFQKKEF